MTDFITIIKNVLEEKGKTVQYLLDSKIISRDTFYKYKQRNPSLSTLIRIANFLQVSIDYLFERSDENHFFKYAENQSGFYENLMKMIGASNMSVRQFCKEMGYAKDNVTRYKHGVQPSVRTVLELADYFRCNIDDLLVLENNQNYS